MKFTTVIVAALAIVSVAQAAAIPVENDAVAAPPYPTTPPKKCGFGLKEEL
ncbi:hypothetical protein FBU30_000941 [Linnemannia zychae]|nr:hypothetical protein FBU30_000941 [Linnemannia zychae]